jgi:FkbM family methyltransferase
MSGPGQVLYRRMIPARARHWLYLVRFFWRESSGLSRLASPGPQRLWLSLVRVAVCFKVALPSRSLRQAPLPVWIRDTGTVFVSHWCDLLVLGEIYSPPREYDFPGLPDTACTIVDLGANIGLSARFLSERYPDARILAFEPDPEIFALAQRNVRAHPQVSLRNLGVAGKNGQLALHRFPGGSWGTSSFVTIQEIAETFTAEAVTLDSIIDEVGDIDLLKIDIEGAEYEVLEACQQLQRVRCIIGEIHAIPDASTEQLFALLDGFDVAAERVLGGQGPFIARRAEDWQPRQTNA